MSSFPATCFQIKGPNFQISRFSCFQLKILLGFMMFGFLNCQVFRFPYLEDSQIRSVQVRSDFPGFKFSVFSDIQNPIFVGLDIDFPVDRFSDSRFSIFHVEIILDFMIFRFSDCQTSRFSRLQHFRIFRLWKFQISIFGYNQSRSDFPIVYFPIARFWGG